MNSSRPVLSLCALMLTFALAASAEDRSPQDILTSKGLFKAKLVYVLPEDAKLPDSLREVRALRAKLDASIRKRAEIQREIDYANDQVAAWEEQNREMTERLEKTNKNAIGNYNRLVREINPIRRNLRESVKPIAQRQKDLQAVEDPTDDYVAAVIKLSDTMEGLVARYDKLAADEEVKAAIQALNGPGKPKVQLGPSEQFTQELPGIRKQRHTVAASAIALEFEGGVPHVVVTINDSVKVPMIVDSGAAAVTISADVAKKLGLAPGPDDKVIHLVTADGKVTDAHLMTLRSMRVGPFTVENVECAVQPKGIKAANLLGGTFLRRFVYKMDLAAKELRMTQITVKAGVDPAAPLRPTAPPSVSVTKPPAVAATQAAPGTRPAVLLSDLAYTVPADAQWHPVDFDVVEGKCYRIDATGRWTDSSGVACGPEGVCPREWLSALGPQPGLPKEHRAEWYVGQHPHSALIARIGEAKVGFYVGTGATFIAPASGPLAFRMNDGDAASRARAGALDVTVTETQPHWLDANGSATIFARIDAVDRLHVTPDGIFWEWGGQWGKVGEHDGHFPTIINGILWWPKWVDKKHTEPLREPELRLRGAVELARVETKRGGVTLEQSSATEVILQFKDNGLGSSQVGCEVRFTAR
jgi:clan AA aspartic protease (TIGR02281 family)